MRILLLVTAFNGLSQRVWCSLQARGHGIGVQIAGDGASIIGGVRSADPDLVLCPYLTKRIPAEVWQHWPTVVIHPGPFGDRGRVVAGLGHQRRPRPLGRHRAAGRPRNRRRADLGDAHVHHAGRRPA